MQDALGSESDRTTVATKERITSNNGETAVAKDDEGVVIPSTPTVSWDSVNNTPSDNSISNDKSYRNWSEVLKTPSTDDVCSPSIDIQKPGNLHGLALQLTTSRSQKLSRCGQKCAALLFDISKCHDIFASELQKSCQNLIQPGSAVNQVPVAGLVHATQKSLVSFAKQVQGLSICIKGSVARPWKGYMTTLGELAPNIYQGYSSARTKAFQARQVALSVRAKYIHTVQEAEAVISELGEYQKTKSVGGGSDTGDQVPLTHTTDASSNENNDWESKLRDFGAKNGVIALTDRVICRVKETHSLEAQYKLLVQQENQAVEHVETMEIMALEALSKLEEERLQNFMETVSRTLEAEKGALDKMVLSLQEDKVDSLLITPEKKKKLQQQDFFANLLIPRQSGQYEEGMGIMDAETLGLPQEVGKLRDEARSRLEARSLRMQAMRALATFLDEVASATASLSTSILSRLAQDGYGSNRSKLNGTLAADIAANEGPNALQIWADLMGSFEQGAETLQVVTKNLRSTRHEKLDVFLVRADKELKVASESDDMMWKHLCEAARVETKADQRYKQTLAQSVKARERVKSVDSDSANNDQGIVSGNFKQSVSKALGNMFSVLPDGGDQAMQIFAPDARRAVAQSNLEEADQKEAKSRHYLQAATLNKSKALASYKAKAEGLVASYSKEDEVGWLDIRVALQSMVEEFERFRAARYDSLTNLFSAVQKEDAEHFKRDMKTLTERVKKRVTDRIEQVRQFSSEPGLDVAIDDGAQHFSLPLVLSTSQVFGDFMAAWNVVFDTDSNAAPMFQTSEIGIASTDISQQSDTAVKASSHKDIGALVETHPDSRNFARSFTAPVCSADTDNGKEAQKRSSFDEVGDSWAPEDRKARVDRFSSYGAILVPTPTGTNPESDVFLAHFWSDRNEPPPTVIESFSCAYWPKEGEGYLSPLLHGRLFATAEAMYFVGWGGKKIELKWKDVESVEKAKNLMGTIDNAIRVAFETEEGTSTYFFGSFSFRENAFTLMERLSTIAKSLKEIDQTPKLSDNVPTLISVPPDEVLKRMDVVLSNTIENITIQRFYDIVWSEGNGTEARPFYKPWLMRAAHNVDVGNWEFAEKGGPGFVNKWCGESYGQKRVVRFKFQRKTHLYIGPPIADVIQTHHCRIENNDKVVLAMTVEFEGIPYADTFAVEVRWVARREGLNDIKVDVGLFVDFRKSTFLKKQISSGTVAETKPVHQNLFEAAKRACLSAGDGVAEEVREEQKVEHDQMDIEPPKNVEAPKLFDMNALRALGAALVAFLILRWAILCFWSLSYRNQFSADDVNRLYERIDDLETELRRIRETTEEVLTILTKRNDEG